MCAPDESTNEAERIKDSIYINILSTQHVQTADIKANPSFFPHILPRCPSLQPHVHIPRSLHCYSLPVHQMPCDFSTCYCHLTDSESSHSLPPRTDPSPSHPSHLPDLPRPPAHLFPLSPTSPAVLTRPFSLTRR